MDDQKDEALNNPLPNIDDISMGNTLLPNAHEAKQNESPNAICNSCLLWQKFGEKCYVFWEKKKFCTQRVIDVESWKEQQRLMQ